MRITSTIILLFCYQCLFADEVLLTLAGSNTVGQRLAPACAKSYLEEQGLKHVRVIKGNTSTEYLVVGDESLTKSHTSRKAIKISAHGSSEGFRGLVQGSADIAMSSRPIKGKEVVALKSRGDMGRAVAEQTVAIDGLSIIAHPDNPVSAVSIDQVAKVFSGEIKNWKFLGGPDRKITLYARDENSGTWDTFKKLVLSGSFPLLPGTERFESNNVLSKRVSQDIEGIGFVGFASVGEAKLLAISDNDTLPMRPNAFTVATEDYPLSRRLYFYLPPDTTNRHAKRFIDFCQSFKGQSIVERVGLISQNIQQFKISPIETMPFYYQKLAGRAERLSLNLRFLEGSPQLDTKALRDIDRLAGFLQDVKQDYPYVYLVGFSEKGNRFSEDVVLSRFRALAVRSALVRNDIDILSSRGLGSFMPIANNNDPLGKRKNARVEVWVSRNLITFD